jgi:hypothetical protein
MSTQGWLKMGSEEKPVALPSGKFGFLVPVEFNQPKACQVRTGRKKSRVSSPCVNLARKCVDQECADNRDKMAQIGEAAIRKCFDKFKSASGADLYDPRDTDATALGREPRSLQAPPSSYAVKTAWDVVPKEDGLMKSMPEANPREEFFYVVEADSAESATLLRIYFDRCELDFNPDADEKGAHGLFMTTLCEKYGSDLTFGPLCSADFKTRTSMKIYQKDGGYTDAGLEDMTFDVAGNLGDFSFSTEAPTSQSGSSIVFSAASSKTLSAMTEAEKQGIKTSTIAAIGTTLGAVEGVDVTGSDISSVELATARRRRAATIRVSVKFAFQLSADESDTIGAVVDSAIARGAFDLGPVATAQKGTVTVSSEARVGEADFVTPTLRTTVPQATQRKILDQGLVERGDEIGLKLQDTPNNAVAVAEVLSTKNGEKGVTFDAWYATFEPAAKAKLALVDELKDAKSFLSALEVQLGAAQADYTNPSIVVNSQARKKYEKEILEPIDNNVKSVKKYTQVLESMLDDVNSVLLTACNNWYYDLVDSGNDYSSFDDIMSECTPRKAGGTTVASEASSSSSGDDTIMYVIIAVIVVVLLYGCVTIAIFVRRKPYPTTNVAPSGTVVKNAAYEAPAAAAPAQQQQRKVLTLDPYGNDA